MLAIIIADSKAHLSTLNLPMGKNAICYKSLAQKKRLLSKQVMHYIINNKNLFHKNICLSSENLCQESPSASISDFFNLRETGC